MTSVRRGATLPQLALAALLDLVLPATCASCLGPGAPLCGDCCDELHRGLFEHPLRVVPRPCPEGLPDVTACGPYAGVLRYAITAYKDEDRRDLVSLLAPLLLASVQGACPAGNVAVVPVPSSRAALRRRGDAPVTDLARRALRGDESGRLTLLPALGAVRRMTDQARLGSAARAANLDGAYAVGERWGGWVTGRRVVV
ncbi:MAG: ComF family protein, partial [Actinomycetota bacterium]|nr:ComF family protein [Actinomycetota bacterium]